MTLAALQYSVPTVRGKQGTGRCRATDDTTRSAAFSADTPGPTGDCALQSGLMTPSARSAIEFRVKENRAQKRVSASLQDNDGLVSRLDYDRFLSNPF
jgi:hypothetical protein